MQVSICTPFDAKCVNKYLQDLCYLCAAGFLKYLYQDLQRSEICVFKGNSRIVIFKMPGFYIPICLCKSITVFDELANVQDYFVIHNPSLYFHFLFFYTFNTRKNRIFCFL